MEKLKRAVIKEELVDSGWLHSRNNPCHKKEEI